MLDSRELLAAYELRVVAARFLPDDRAEELANTIVAALCGDPDPADGGALGIARSCIGTRLKSDLYRWPPSAQLIDVGELAAALADAWGKSK